MTAKAYSRKQNINGINLYYEYYPNENAIETIILLHGYLSSTFCYRHLIPILKNEYSVISIDLPPFGKSGISKGFIYSYRNMAQTVINLLEFLHIENQVVLTGHSMGGQICLNIMDMRPDLVKKGILLCSSSYLEKVKNSLILSSYLPFFFLFVKRHLERSGLQKNLRNVVYNHSLINEEMMRGYELPFLQDDIFKGLTKMIRHREGDLPASVLQNIDTPILLIWGKEDKVVPLSIGKRLHQDLPNSELIIFNETGHLVPEEKPEEVFKCMNDFILK
jgi:pimeloyl-ACP methyl ester carboxylesterase